MTTLELARRRRERNPLWPYHWRVHYRDGSTCAQYDLAGGYHSAAREIRAAEVVRLDVLGHPNSPIVLDRPRPEPADEIVARARWTIGYSIGHPNLTSPEPTCAVLFGWRYGAAGYVIRLDEHGRIDAGVIPLIPAATDA